jgi:hypothetical protein
MNCRGHVSKAPRWSKAICDAKIQKGNEAHYARQTRQSHGGESSKKDDQHSIIHGRGSRRGDPGPVEAVAESLPRSKGVYEPFMRMDTLAIEAWGRTSTGR